MGPSYVDGNLYREKLTSILKGRRIKVSVPCLYILPSVMETSPIRGHQRIAENCKNVPFTFSAHPNVVAFVSHCGIGSLLEAVYYKVPIVGIGIFGDQVIFRPVFNIRNPLDGQ